MIFLTMLFIVSILGALIGTKKPWMGGFAGLLVALSLFYFNTSFNLTSIVVCALIFMVLSTAYGYISSMIISGLKGGRHNVGQTFMSGFGAHHPGGIILSDEELNILKDKNIKRIEISSY